MQETISVKSDGTQANDTAIFFAAAKQPAEANAAHFIAACLTPGSGFDLSKMSVDIREDFAILRGQLESGGWLKPYMRSDGAISIW